MDNEGDIMDNLDMTILSRLLNNCRESDRQIGIELGMSGGAVRARIQKMQERKIIEEFFIKVEPPVLGYGILYFVVSGQNINEILEQANLVGKPYFMVDDRDLIGFIGRRHEITARFFPAAVVQKQGGIDGGDLEIVEIAVVDQLHLAGFLDVDDKFRVLVRGDDGGNPGLGMVFQGIHGQAAGGNNLPGLERVTIHHHELWRPVGAGNGERVFVALVFGGFDGTGFQTDLDFGHGFRFLHPQVDEIYPGVAPNHEEITP